MGIGQSAAEKQGQCHSGILGAGSATDVHGVRVTGALFHTQGGLQVDAMGRVLDRAGHALPNLFAAGGAARGVSGDAAWGYLSGNGLLSAFNLDNRAVGQASGLHKPSLH